jgi:hypothetical protein
MPDEVRGQGGTCPVGVCDGHVFGWCVCGVCAGCGLRVWAAGMCGVRVRVCMSAVGACSAISSGMPLIVSIAASAQPSSTNDLRCSHPRSISSVAACGSTRRCSSVWQQRMAAACGSSVAAASQRVAAASQRVAAASQRVAAGGTAAWLRTDASSSRWPSGDADQV